MSVIRLARSCPNLLHVKLDGATNLTGAPLLTSFMYCPGLQYIQFSGNDKVTVLVKGTVLDALRENFEMTKNR